MSVPFQLVWSDVSNNILSDASFPIVFPEETSIPRQIQLRTNAIALQTYNTLIGVKFFLTGNLDDIETVQNVWPGLGGTNKPELDGGLEISFDFGRTYVRFDSTHGVEGSPQTYISLPVEAVGTTGASETLGAFDTAHLIVRYVIPPGASQSKKFDLRLALDFDII